MVQDTVSSLVFGIALIAAGFVAFIALREFFCWYLKISKRLDYEKAIFFILYRTAQKNDILTDKDKSDLFLMTKDKELKEFITYDVRKCRAKKEKE